MNQFDYDFTYTSDAELADKITRLAAQINVANYHFLKMLAEFDNRQGWKEHGVKCCSHWLNWKCNISYCAAREKIRVAHALEKLPKINHAFANGKLSYSKVRAMTRVATDDNEEVLLNVAEDFSASHVEKLVNKYKLVDEDQQIIVPPEDDDARELNYYQDENGMWVITAKLPQVEGGLMVKAIEEVIRQTNTSNSKNASTPAEAFKQKRADALCAITEHYIATAKVDGIKALAGHERCQVVLHIEKDNQHIDGFRVSKRNAERFSCDAKVLSVLEGENGEVLNLGRNARTVSPSLKRVLDMRDTTCRFPGCTCNRYVEYHHVKHWSDGGETKPENLVKLCRHHHDLIHNGHFTVEWRNNNWLFKTMSGEVISPSPNFPNVNLVKWPDLPQHTGGSKAFGWRLDYPKALKDLLINKSNRKFIESTTPP